MNAKTQRIIRFVLVLGLLTALTVAISGCYDSSGYDPDKDPFGWGHNAPVEKHTNQEPQIVALGKPSAPQVQDTMLVGTALHPPR